VRLADLDNDGDLDLIANTYHLSQSGPHRNYILANDGDGRFSEVTGFTKLNIQGFGETIVVADFDNDGFTDFYLPAHFRDDQGVHPVTGSRLLMNSGGLVFTDKTVQYPVTGAGYVGLVSAAPWDGSRRGWRWLVYELYRSLKLSSAPWGADQSNAIIPEGAQAVDFDQDGLIDLYVGPIFSKTTAARSRTLPPLWDCQQCLMKELCSSIGITTGALTFS
jgi:FG-GAP-like repeat